MLKEDNDRNWKREWKKSRSDKRLGSWRRDLIYVVLVYCVAGSIRLMQSDCIWMRIEMNFSLFMLALACWCYGIDAYIPIAKNLTPQEIAEFEKRNANPSGHQLTLDSSGKYDLRWEYDNNSITFDVTAEATGWIGLGFTPTNGMTNADIVFIWIDTNGKGRISDRHATANQYPEKDKMQDYTLLAATKSGNHFNAKFRRLRDTCDDEGDYVLTTDNVRIIYAFSDVQPQDENHFEKHLATNKGIKGLFLFEPPDVSNRLPTDTVTLDLLSDATHLPTDFHMMYWCQIFELPKWPVHHLIRLEPVVELEHEQYIHHLGLYQCSKNMSTYLNKGEKCFTGDGFNFSKTYECTSKLLWFWNPGMKPSDFPDGVGLPLFESSEDSYLLLEVHYENLDLTPGIIDHSGIRLYLTPTLRPVEAGFIFLGTPEQAPNQLLPPGDPDFHFFGHFEKCLAYLPKNGTYFLYSLLHQHLYGKRIRMHHYRNGVQLPDYAIDDNYDFYSQNFRLLDPPRLVLPGDELVLECVFNTSRTNKTIYGGYSTVDEMCDATNIYYPRVAKGFTCVSYPDPHVYVPMFGGKLVDNTTVHLPSNTTVTLYEFVKHHLDWEKPGLRQEYKELVSNGQYLEHFYYQPFKNSTDNHDPPVQLQILQHNGYPKVTQAWTPEVNERDCSSVHHDQGDANEHNQGNAQDKAANEKPFPLTERSTAAKEWPSVTIFVLLSIMLSQILGL